MTHLIIFPDHNQNSLTFPDLCNSLTFPESPTVQVDVNVNVDVNLYSASLQK